MLENDKRKNNKNTQIKTKYKLAKKRTAEQHTAICKSGLVFILPFRFLKILIHKRFLEFWVCNARHHCIWYGLSTVLVL